MGQEVRPIAHFALIGPDSLGRSCRHPATLPVYASDMAKSMAALTTSYLDRECPDGVAQIGECQTEVELSKRERGLAVQMFASRGSRGCGR